MDNTFTLAQIAQHIGAEVIGDDKATVSSVATLLSASAHQISFLANPKYRAQLEQTQAAAVIVTASQAADVKTNALVMKDPYVGFAKVAQLLDTTPAPASNVHPTAVIAEDVRLGRRVCVGANAVIESGCQIADDVIIGAGCFIGKNVSLGQGTKLWANVSVYHNCQLGEQCLVQAGTVIGSDGFGYANENGKWLKIPQLGRVVIGDKVEIGANCTIDRGALDDTVIGDGVILDNLIQIAHNVQIGEQTAMAAASIVAGSTTIGSYCTFGGMAGVNGHIEIPDRCHITAMSMVTKSIKESGVYSSGIPATTNAAWRKNTVAMRNIGEFGKRIKALEKQLEQLQQENGNE